MAYGGQKLEIEASFKAEISAPNRPPVFDKVYVIRNAQRSLIGRETAVKMKYLHFDLVMQLAKGTTDPDHPLEETSSPASASQAKEFPKVPNYVVRFHIDPNVVPVIRPRVKIPVHLLTEVQANLDKMEEQGILRKPTQPSRWYSPMEIVHKAPGSYRIVIDMREPNKAITRARYPLPEVRGIMHKLAGAGFFTKLDLKSAFHHLPIDEASQELTTFMTPKGPRCFTRLVFGANTAPEEFQKFMDTILTDLDGVIVFIDDLLIFEKTLAELKSRTKIVIKRLKENNLTLNKDKCSYDQTEVIFVGSKINKDGVHPTKDKVALVKGFKTPTKIEEIRSFLGTVQFLGPHIRNLSDLTEPLRRLIKKEHGSGKGPIVGWAAEQDTAFEAIKEAVANAQTLAFFNADGSHETGLYVDASPTGLGAVLVKRKKPNPNETWHAIEYASKTLTAAEAKYSQTQREALAIVWGVERYHFYLLGQPFTVFGDHKAHDFIFNGKYRDSARAINRAEGWALRLTPYDFKHKFIRGEDNIADSFSRLATIETEERAYEEIAPGEKHGEIASIRMVLDSNILANLPALTSAEVDDATEKDEDLQQVIKAVQTGNWKQISKPIRTNYLSSQWEYSCEGKSLMKDGKLVIPKTLREKALTLAHLSHPGMVVMKRTLRRTMWWPGMDREIESYCGNCDACSLVARKTAPEPIAPSKLPERPWQHLAIDFYDAGSDAQKLCVLVVKDYYSRYKCCSILDKKDSQEVTRALTTIFATFGFPDSIKADNGPPYGSADFQKWCKEKGISLWHSAPYAPQENGMVERSMQSLTKALQTGKVLKMPPKEAIAQMVYAYNHQPHSVTGETPANVLFGREIRGYLPVLAHHKILTEDQIRTNDAASKEKGKIYIDNKRRALESDIQVGDSVTITNRKRSNKLDPPNVATKLRVIERENRHLTMQSEDGQIVTRSIDDARKRPERDIFTSNMKSMLENEQSQPAAQDATTAITPVPRRPERARRSPARNKDFIAYYVANDQE